MTHNPKNIPRLHSGEQILLKAQGSYKHNIRSGWKVAPCLLTNRRLMMLQRASIRLEVSLDDIKGLVVEKLHYVLRQRECLAISYHSAVGAKAGRIWFIANDLEAWRKKITAHSAFFTIDSQAIEKISAKTDSDSQDILWYLWERSHAKIEALAELIDAPNHMHVLLKIRETINPIAEKTIGCPIMLFERSKVDPETGEAVLFSWWLAGRPDEPARTEERLLDIFDEGSHIQVIIEVREVKASDVRIEVSGDELTVKFDQNSPDWKEVIHLPAEASSDSVDMHLTNNLLEIRLAKVRHSTSNKQ